MSPSPRSRDVLDTSTVVVPGRTENPRALPDGPLNAAATDDFDGLDVVHVAVPA